jgi:hypothetical protein
MSDKIKRVTPREIAEMIWTEQAYAATRFVLADAHDAEIARLRARVEVLETALRYYADDSYNGHNTNGSCARAALEAKP